MVQEFTDVVGKVDHQAEFERLTSQSNVLKIDPEHDRVLRAQLLLEGVGHYIDAHFPSDASPEIVMLKEGSTLAAGLLKAARTAQNSAKDIVKLMGDLPALARSESGAQKNQLRINSIVALALQVMYNPLVALKYRAQIQANDVAQSSAANSKPEVIRKIPQLFDEALQSLNDGLKLLNNEPTWTKFAS